LIECYIVTLATFYIIVRGQSLYNHAAMRKNMAKLLPNMDGYA
jgi:hypothetical protein